MFNFYFTCDRFKISNSTKKICEGVVENLRKIENCSVGKIEEDRKMFGGKNI